MSQGGGLGGSTYSEGRDRDMGQGGAKGGAGEVSIYDKLKQQYPNRYFLMKKFTKERLGVAFDQNYLVTSKKNEAKLADAFKVRRNKK
jgi:hypothetical protein